MQIKSNLTHPRLVSLARRDGDPLDDLDLPLRADRHPIHRITRNCNIKMTTESQLLLLFNNNIVLRRLKGLDVAVQPSVGRRS